MKSILFACIHNAGRSQMAAALFNRWADPEKARAISAGTEPGERVHPEVVEVMKELKLDLSAARPQRLTDELATTIDMLVTMGCGEACPVVPGIERDDWPLEDPKGKPIARVRAIRNEIEHRVQSLLAARTWGSTTSDGLSLPDGAIPVGLTIQPAGLEDEGAIRALLIAAGLPIEGIVVGFPAGFAVARRATATIGCAGLETYAEDGLLRSIAVSTGERRSGIGAALVRDRLSAAKGAGLRAVYLLTTTAPGFFRRLGFEPIDRSAVPVAVQSASEFASICPASAACMRRLIP